jgi:hypothetical protein
LRGSDVCIFSNQVAYLVYVVLLVVLGPILEGVSHVRARIKTTAANRTTVHVEATVTRGDASLRIFHGAFLSVTAINIGIGQIVIPLLTIIRDYAFVIMLLETLAWAYLFYLNSWTRNKLIGLVMWVSKDR